MEIRIGCSGWQYDEWKGKFFPSTLARKDWFEYYLQHFDTVELNYPFYRVPSKETVRRWYQQAPKKFLYAIKANRVITHYKKFIHTKKLINNFYSLLDLLEEKLGCVLFQFPKNFIYQKESLARIIKQLDVSKRNILEFRHPSWWREDVWEILQQKNITFCTVSAPEIPGQFVKTSKIFYMRLHGVKEWYSGSYSKRELNQVVQWLKINRFKECWIYFDNTANGDAPKDALALLKILDK